MTRHYPKNMAVKLEAPEWVSQETAANELDVNLLRIGLLIANDHLEAAETTARLMGVSRDSLDAEKHWRQSSSFINRVKRLAQDSINWM
jgi:hypothetical protein